MNSKVCSKCNIDKSVNDFHKFKHSKDGLKPRCKACNTKDAIKYRKDNSAKRKMYDDKYRERLKHYPVVYLLIKENYVGTTSRLRQRINQHRHNGKFVDDFIVLATFNNRKDALSLEEFMHELGYGGRHINNLYK